MPTFDFAALDPGGRTRTGTLSAASERDARQSLTARDGVVVKVGAATADTSPTRVVSGRFRSKDLALVTRQLATLVQVAPVEEALRMIAAQSEKAAVKRVLVAAHATVLEGFRLSEAMARQPRAFPTLYRSMVAAGEGSGALSEILERLADLLERQQAVRSRLTAALAYPAALTVTAIGVVIALMAVVVPKVVDQFDSMGRTLPWLTRAVIAVSEAIRDWGLVIAMLIVLGGLAGAYALRREPVRLAVDGALLRLPVLGRVLRDIHAARLARTLSTMITSGLPLMEGLRITARTITNRVLRRSVETMADAIREGGSLSAAMRRAAVFPPTLVYMASSGENSGRLAPMLDRAADYLEREFGTFTSTLLSLLEPVIIIVLGGVVALIVLSILLPILQFNSLVLG